MRAQEFETSIVDFRCAPLLDVVPGRTAHSSVTWLLSRTREWQSQVTAGTLDLSGPYRRASEVALPQAVLVVDPFHVVKHAVHQMDERRRRVQNEIHGHKDDPPYRARRL